MGRRRLEEAHCFVAHAGVEFGGVFARASKKDRLKAREERWSPRWMVGRVLSTNRQL